MYKGKRCKRKMDCNESEYIVECKITIQDFEKTMRKLNELSEALEKASSIQSELAKQKTLKLFLKI